MSDDLNPSEWDDDALESATWEAGGSYTGNIVAWARFCWWVAT